MPDAYRQRATELLQRAASERDPGRQRYLAGLAAAYEELSRQRGEPEPSAPPAAMTRAERRSAAVEFRGRGLSQPAIAKELGVSQQLVSVLLREAATTNGDGVADLGA